MNEGHKKGRHAAASVGVAAAFFHNPHHGFESGIHAQSPGIGHYDRV